MNFMVTLFWKNFWERAAHLPATVLPQIISDVPYSDTVTVRNPRVTHNIETVVSITSSVIQQCAFANRIFELFRKSVTQRGVRNARHQH